VLALNSGSSSFGRGNSLSLNQPGGSFMSGRPAGGGGAAGGENLLFAALAQPAASTQGGLGDIGPPPVTPTPLPLEVQQPQVPHLPSFSPTPFIPSQPGLSTSPVWPGFTPIPQPDPRRRTNYFF